MPKDEKITRSPAALIFCVDEPQSARPWNEEHSRSAAQKGGKKHRKLKPRAAFLLAVGTHDLGCWKNFQAFILPHRATGRMDRSETAKESSISPTRRSLRVMVRRRSGLFSLVDGGSSHAITVHGY
jgi:hypothetical protein